MQIFLFPEEIIIKSLHHSMKTEIPGLKKQVILRFIMVPIFMGLMLFLPAGTLYYWQAWIYCGVLLIPVSFVVLYFLKKTRNSLSAE